MLTVDVDEPKALVEEFVQQGKYTLPVLLTDGTDVVDKIRQVKTGNKAGHQDVPVEDVVIERAEQC